MKRQQFRPGGSGLLGGGNNPSTIYNGMRTTESIFGTTIPILIGQQRLSWKLLWYGDFTAAQAQSAGGSGLMKGGAQYVYSASVIGSVCMGPCTNFLGVWDSIGRYAMLSTSEPYTVSAPYTYNPLNQTTFKQDLGVGLANSYSVTANDYGSPGSITQTGTQQLPLVYTTSATPGPGQYTVTSTPSVGPFAATSITAGSGTAMITGTFTGGGSNAFANYVVTVKGSNFAANNGQFTVTASTTTTLTISNANSISDTSNIVVNSLTGMPTYVFNSAQNGADVIVNYVAYEYHIEETELDVVPNTSPPGIVVQYQAFQPCTPVSVNYYPSGDALTEVDILPTAVGTFNWNTGNVQFAPGDVGAAVTITYIYNNYTSDSDSNAPNKINLSFFGGELGQAVWAYTAAGSPSQTLGYSELAYVASIGLYLGYSPVLPQYNFEIAGPYQFGGAVYNNLGVASPNPDANPAVAIYALLTNPSYKLNFPVLNIGNSLLVGDTRISGNVSSGTFTAGEQVVQQTTGANALLIGTVTGSNTVMEVGYITGPANADNVWVGQTSSAYFTPNSLPTSTSVSAMWIANSFFISAIIDSQTSLMGIMSKWCEAGQVYMSWDEGLLKFTPLYDTTAVDNGAVYSPPTQPIIDLDDNDFVVSKNQDPIKVEQTSWQNRWNKVQIRWAVRSNSYNEDILQIQDEASVQQFGLMQENPQDYQFLCTEIAAQFAANMRLQRYSAIYTKYSFTLKANFAFLSPGDIITITDGLLGTSGTMFGRTPCRITKMTDDPKKGVIIEAENYPWSVGAALLNNKQAQIPANTGDGPQAPPGDTSPIIFEVPNRATTWDGDTIYIFANGSNVNWGGFQVWVSFNGTDYNFYGQYTKPGRIGTVVSCCTLTFTQVAVSGSTVTYSYSSYLGGAPTVNQVVIVSGFVNAGNNSTITLTHVSGGSSGTVQAVLVAQVNETNPGTGEGDFPTYAWTPPASSGLPVLDSTDTLIVQMDQADSQLLSVTSPDNSAFVTLSALVSEGVLIPVTNTAQNGGNTGSPSVSSVGPNIAGLGMNTAGGTGASGIFLNGSVTLWFWYQYLGQNNDRFLPATTLSSPALSFPLTIGTVADGPQTVNSLLFNPPQYNGTTDPLVQPAQWATLSSAGTITGYTSPWSGTNDVWAMSAMFELVIPVAGNYTITISHDDGMFFGFNNSATRISGPISPIYHGNTAVNSYPVLGGIDANAPHANYFDTYVINFPTATVYSGEINYYNYISEQNLGVYINGDTPYAPPSLWQNPNNVTSSSSHATVSLSTTVTSTVAKTSQNLDATQFGFNIAYQGGGIIVGVQVTLKSYVSSSTPSSSANNPNLVAQLIYKGNPIGSPITVWSGPYPAFPTSSTTYTLGLNTSLAPWGLGPTSSGSSPLTAVIVNDPSFGVRFVSSVAASSSATDTVDVYDVQVEVTWGSAGAGTAWSNTTSVSSSVTYASSTLSTSTSTQWLNTTSYGFNQPFGFVLTGVSVSVGSYGGSTADQLSAQLMYQGFRIGNIQIQNVTASPATYTFGGAGQLWGQTTLDVDAVNDPTFGVALLMQGVLGETMNINNVQITLYGYSTYNLELISYQTATLVAGTGSTAQNTYELTGIQRGVYGSYPCDHPIGSTFVRMDQASLTYIIDPTYTGNEIYFKFLSFNAYGNQLQSLSAVVPYSVAIGGLSPGAIDGETGALLTGIGTTTDTVGNSTIRYSVNELAATHEIIQGSYGIQNIPAGYGLLGPQTIGNAATTPLAGPPVWVPLIAGGGGNGSLANLYVIEVSGSFTAAAWDDVICSTAGGALSVTLPPAESNANTAVAVQKNTTDANAVTILPSSGDTVQMASSLTISSFGDSLYFVSYGGTNWVILSGWIQPANDIYIWIPVAAGTYTNNQILYYAIPVRAFTLPVSLAGSHAGCLVAPTGNIQVTINKNGSSVGTVNIAASATTATFTFASAVTFNGTTDVIEFVAPVTADATFEGFYCDLLASRSL